MFISKKDLERLVLIGGKLETNNYLNDEIINYEMTRMMKQQELSWSPNSYFFAKLRESGNANYHDSYLQTRRWGKKHDIFALNCLCFHVNTAVHWSFVYVTGLRHIETWTFEHEHDDSKPKCVVYHFDSLNHDTENLISPHIRHFY